MGLLTIIRKAKRKEKEMRLLMVGLDNAGKTTIVKKLNNEDISNTSPTLGFNIKSMTYDKYRLNIWDVGGQKTLRAYWRNYYEKTDGLVWVVDSVDVVRLEDCRKELQELLMEERVAGATLLVLANKQDIEGGCCHVKETVRLLAVGALTVEEVTEFLGLEALKKRHWKAVACSAVAGSGLVEGFDWIVSDVGKRIFYSL